MFSLSENTISLLPLNEEKIQLSVGQTVKDEVLFETLHQESDLLGSFGFGDQMESFKNFCFLLLVFRNGQFFLSEPFVELFSKMIEKSRKRKRKEGLTASLEGSIMFQILDVNRFPLNLLLFRYFQTCFIILFKSRNKI